MEVNPMCEEHGIAFKVVCGEEMCGMCWAEEFLGPEPTRRQRPPKVKVEMKMRHHRVSRH
jgi:ferredoxin